MRTLSFVRVGLSVAIVTIAAVLMMLGFWIKPDVSQNTAHRLHASQIYKRLTRQSLRADYVFIPASHKYMYFVGRWTATSNQLRRDAAFPGSYLEVAVTNTTSVYCDLNNVHIDEEDENPQALLNGNVDHAILLPADPRQSPSGQISMLVQINSEDALGFDAAHGIVLIAEGLDPGRTYKLKITHLGSANANHGAIEVEGLWIDKPTAEDFTEENVKLKPKFGLRNPLLRDNNGRMTKTTTSRPRAEARTMIEIVTSDSSFPPFQENEPAEVMDGRLQSWTDHFRKNLSLDTVVIPTSSLGLIPYDSSPNTINDLFFRSGPVSTPHFSRPWSFGSYRPSVLILQPGLVDFMSFFADKNNHGDHAVDKFKSQFKTACIHFVRNIRATAYPFESTKERTTLFVAGDGSYGYNSAPSTLPIFLLAPFTASRRFVTKQQKLDVVISEVLSQVASALQAEGDKSTFWIDTSGWLDSRADFIPRFNFTLPRTRLDPALLTPFAHFKVASLLADHLCSYMNIPKAGLLSPREDCQFERYDSYLGNLYTPEDVEFNRAVLERKIAIIKEQFKVDSN